MDARRFDQISRGLAAVTSRRTTLGGGVAAAVAAVLPGVAQDGVAKKKKCKQAKKCAGKVCGNFGCKGRSCGECSGNQTCNAQGQCESCKPNCAGKTCGSDSCGGSCGPCEPKNSCEDAICSDRRECVRINVPAGTSCGPNGQQCNSGACLEPPTCLMGDVGCTSGGQCCSEVCLPKPVPTCFFSGAGEPCLVSNDCVDDLVCVAYRCVAT